mmetsp:Transcript_11411/g.14308  ORF Transcript_11411/g.14308 Transcript_11411/m.14308 type:complete len:107 (+) Transcript_11411:906-1226(+)
MYIMMVKKTCKMNGRVEIEDDEEDDCDRDTEHVDNSKGHRAVTVRWKRLHEKDIEHYIQQLYDRKRTVGETACNNDGTVRRGKLRKQEGAATKDQLIVHRMDMLLL